MKPIISEHAKERVSERVGVSKSSAERLTMLAKERGVRMEDIAGKFRHYLNNERHHHYNDDVILYGNALYMFNDGVCATVLVVPERFRKTAEMVQKKHSKEKNNE